MPLHAIVSLPLCLLAGLARIAGSAQDNAASARTRAPRRIPRSRPARKSSRPAGRRPTISPAPITTAPSHTGRRTRPTTRYRTTAMRSRSIRNTRRAFNNRGTIYKEKGDLDRAIADFSEAIRLDPKFAAAYFNRGNAYDDKGDDAKALADLDHGDPARSEITPRPIRSAAWCGSARAISTARSRTSAQAIELDPATRWPTPTAAMRGTRRATANARSPTSCARSTSIRTTPARSRSAAILYRKKGDLDRAIVDYGEIIRIDPKSDDAYMRRSEAWLPRATGSRRCATPTRR